MGLWKGRASGPSEVDRQEINERTWSDGERGCQEVKEWFVIKMIMVQDGRWVNIGRERNT